MVQGRDEREQNRAQLFISVTRKLKEPENSVLFHPWFSVSTDFYCRHSNNRSSNAFSLRSENNWYLSEYIIYTLRFWNWPTNVNSSIYHRIGNISNTDAVLLSAVKFGFVLHITDIVCVTLGHTKKQGKVWYFTIFSETTVKSNFKWNHWNHQGAPLPWDTFNLWWPTICFWM